MSANETKKRAAPSVSRIDLSMLSEFSLEEVMAGGMRAAAGGVPLEIPVENVVEDSQQARGEDNPGFGAESLAELAASILESKGVKTPISVRSRNAEGKYVLNHGARRLRASKLAGMATIRANIDDTHDDYDQAVENIQRESFTPMEIALFIRKREQAGDERTTIAKRLGKSKSFVTFHAALLELPPMLHAVYDKGQCRDSLTLYQLSNLAKDHPEEVSRFVEATPEITRSAFESLKTSLRGAASREPEPSQSEAATSFEESPSPALQSPIEFGQAGEKHAAEPDGQADNSTSTATARPKEASLPAKSRRPSVMVRQRKTLFVLRPDIKPSALHLGWIEDPDTKTTAEVELSDLRIDSIVAR